MLTATTLVHKGAMQISIHAIRTFAFHFAKTHSLNIHTDSTTEESDHKILLEAAKGIDAKIISAQERSGKVREMLSQYPKTKEFLSQGGIYTKLEIPIFEEAPYFFFDSDIIWLQHVSNLVPPGAPNAFSTESWSWYNGIAKERLWLKAKTPRRINSGFYHIGQEFPFAKMEKMLSEKMFDANIPNATDQEIFAYLFNDMEYYHPEDLKRSRVMATYDLKNESCAALHFPGKMWQSHIDQIEQLPLTSEKPPMEIRYQPAVALTAAELFRMRAQVEIGKSKLLARPLNIIRQLRRSYR